MNRRSFTMLLGTSFSQLLLPTKFAVASELTAKKNNQLNEIRTFWFENIQQTPEEYLVVKGVTEKNVHVVRESELRASKVLEFQGVYFSYCEFALLACLAPIAV